jgi:hypothetical protein
MMGCLQDAGEKLQVMKLMKLKFNEAIILPILLHGSEVLVMNI